VDVEKTMQFLLEQAARSDARFDASKAAFDKRLAALDRRLAAHVIKFERQTTQINENLIAVGFSQANASEILATQAEKYIHLESRHEQLATRHLELARTHDKLAKWHEELAKAHEDLATKQGELARKHAELFERHNELARQYIEFVKAQQTINERFDARLNDVQST
jgi:hypothetical protein